MPLQHLSEGPMLPQPAQTEQVCHISQETLRAHFKGFYQVLADNKFIPDAGFEKVDGIERCITGIPYAFQNAIFGYPKDSKRWTGCIREQMRYFKDRKLPFVWYIDENEGGDFKEMLLANGFQNIGVFRGVAGALNPALFLSEPPTGYQFELVQDEASLTEFNDLVCAIFAIPDSCKEMYKTVLWNAMHASSFQAFNWLARKDGKVVSALTTIIDGEHVSFWNGATLPNLRKTGLSTALRCMALRHAYAQGCRMGSSYLMAEGLAYGICSKLGYQTRWRFNALLSP